MTNTGNTYTTTYGPDGPITLPDDGHRYALAVPRGVSQFLDNLSPHARHHTIAVYGSADLARRLAAAHAAGVCVAFHRLDQATPEAPHITATTTVDEDGDGF